MDRLGIEIEALPWFVGEMDGRPVPYGGGAAIRIKINDRELRDLVRQCESPWAAATGNAGLAGSYGYLSGYRFDQGLFLGEPRDDQLRRAGGVALMQCTCGEVGCWPFLAHVCVSDDEIVWDSFRQPFRPSWSYAELEPLRFARNAYEIELARAGELFAELVVNSREQRDNYERRRAVVPHWPSWDEITRSDN